MVPWHVVNLGDAIMADEALVDVRQRFDRLYHQRGRPSNMALYVRHVPEGRLHCWVTEELHKLMAPDRPVSTEWITKMVAAARIVCQVRPIRAAPGRMRAWARINARTASHRTRSAHPASRCMVAVPPFAMARSPWGSSREISLPAAVIQPLSMKRRNSRLMVSGARPR